MRLVKDEHTAWVDDLLFGPGADRGGLTQRCLMRVERVGGGSLELGGAAWPGVSGRDKDGESEDE
jgi:hypothetical protein